MSKKNDVKKTVTDGKGEKENTQEDNNQQDKIISLYSDKISKSWNKCAQGILETGRIIIDAQEELGAEGYLRLKKALNFHPRTLQRLVAIAKDKRIAENRELMPGSWGTLYELTRLSNEQFSSAMSNKKIHPGITRNAAKELHKPNNKPASETKVDPFKNMVKAYVVYCVEGEVGNVVRKMEELLNESSGISADSEPIDGYLKEQEIQKSKEIDDKQLVGEVTCADDHDSAPNTLAVAV